jgi:hypothetical protein
MLVIAAIVGVMAVILLPIIPAHRTLAVIQVSEDFYIYEATAPELGSLSSLALDLKQDPVPTCPQFKENMLASALYLLTGFGPKITIGSGC